jgi:hypothetical protein
VIAILGGSLRLTPAGGIASARDEGPLTTS